MIAEAENIEMVHPTLKRYYLHDGQIVVFEPQGVNRDTVNAWLKHTLETARNWSPDKPYHELHDMRQSGITRYSRQKATELTEKLGNVKGRAAVVISQTHTGQIIGFFVNNVFNRFNKTRERKVFTEFDQALAWLEEAL